MPILLIAAAQLGQPTAVVGAWDDRPTLTIAEGYGEDLSSVKAAAERCGFSRTWVWDYDSDEAQLWVLAGEASRKRKKCLATEPATRPDARIGAPGSRQWHEALAELPFYNDGGCMMVIVVFDPAKSRVERVFCNGPG